MGVPATAHKNKQANISTALWGRGTSWTGISCASSRRPPTPGSFTPCRRDAGSQPVGDKSSRSGRWKGCSGGRRCFIAARVTPDRTGAPAPRTSFSNSNAAHAATWIDSRKSRTRRICGSRPDWVLAANWLAPRLGEFRGPLPGDQAALAVVGRDDLDLGMRESGTSRSGCANRSSRT